MIKGQDIVLLAKLLTNKESRSWKQSQIAEHLCVSVSTVNASLKRLIESRLIIKHDVGCSPIIHSCKEFLIHGMKYFFHVEEEGCITAGIVTSYASPVMKECIIGDFIPPVWPYAEGDVRGFSSKPLYHSLPKSITLYPDQSFYEFLCLLDVLRNRFIDIRSHTHAIKLLNERIDG